MKRTRPRPFLALLPILAILLAVSDPLAGAAKKPPRPDFTKGDAIPEGATHDWTLGATGARGWMHSYWLETTEARQIAITKVAKGSPADGVLKVGDVILGIYGNLTYEEIKPLLPAIHEAIVKPSPSGIMFAHEIRMNGLELLAKYRVSEGIELLADYAHHQKPHASEKRIATIMELLRTYGAHAQRSIPQLEAAIYYFENDEPDFPKRLSMGKAQCVRETIAAIKASTDEPELIHLNR